MKQPSLSPEVSENPLEASGSKRKSSSSYQRKDPSFGLGHFYFRERRKKDGTIMYYWYYVSYYGGKRLPKEYLGRNTSKTCPPKYIAEFKAIKEARIYKKHSNLLR